MDYLNDKLTLSAFSSDASIYGIKPAAVILVRNSKDVIEAVKQTRQKKLTITPRGGGTGLAGGALGDGIILDFSNFNHVMAVDPAKRYVHTQVGIIYDELNLLLRKFGLVFPPDPSSGDSCQIGGMLANNSSGPRSVKYGLTSHFVEELAVVNSKGDLTYLRKLPINSDELNNFLYENKEYEAVLDILRKNSNLIKSKWPRLKKNSAGYNLLQVINDLENGIFNLPALTVGSEGTLNVIVSAKLKLLSSPKEKLTSRLYFKSILDAGRAVKSILDIDPSGLEIIDGATLDLIGRKKFDIPSRAAALLLIEFDDEIVSKKEKFLDIAEKLELAGPVDFGFDAETAAALWDARKAIVPTLYRHHPNKRPISLVEDISLPTEKIPDFIEFINDLFGKHDLIFGLFGHIGDGNLHVRPLFDLNNIEDYELAQKIYNIVYEKVISSGGSTTAEHADGRLRAPLLKKLYGDEIWDVFKAIKKCLDPENIFSPDSILADKPFTANIDFKKLESFCAACGKCNGYCPAYSIFGREDYSPRGWLRILNQSNGSRKELNKYLSYCLNCKNCTTVCPASVDIAGDIIRFRSEKPSLISRIIINFTDFENLLNLSLKMGRIAEPIMSSPTGRNAIKILGEKPFGYDRSTQFPAIAPKPLRKRFRQLVANSGDVAFFHGCADNLLYSNVGDAFFEVCGKLNIDIKMPDQKCCGLPQEVYGYRANLIKKAKYNIDRLMNFNTVVTGCASCLHRLKEYPELLKDDKAYFEQAKTVSQRCFEISHFLNNTNLGSNDFKAERPLRVTYHTPCHLRADGSQQEPLKLIGKFENIKLVHPDYADRCCGQAGSYGYTYYQEAKRIFSRKKEEYYDIGAEYIMTACPACRMKISSEMGENFKVVHPVEILAEMLI